MKLTPAQMAAQAAVGPLAELHWQPDGGPPDECWLLTRTRRARSKGAYASWHTDLGLVAASTTPAQKAARTLQAAREAWAAVA